MYKIGDKILCVDGSSHPYLVTGREYVITDIRINQENREHVGYFVEPEHARYKYPYYGTTCMFEPHVSVRNANKLKKALDLK